MAGTCIHLFIIRVRIQVQIHWIYKLNLLAQITIPNELFSIFESYVHIVQVPFQNVYHLWAVICSLCFFLTARSHFSTTQESRVWMRWLSKRVQTRLKHWFFGAVNCFRLTNTKKKIFGFAFSTENHTNLFYLVASPYFWIWSKLKLNNFRLNTSDDLQR